jgi:two-component system sensor histidine kinase/response regulator
MNDQPLGTVLVVDDDPVNRHLMRELLTTEGHRVQEAADGDQALSAVRRAPPDVILLDIMMPGMDGFQVCRILKNDPATAPLSILIITALGDRPNRLKGIEAGADDYLTKPIDINEVNLRLRNALRTKRLNDQLRNQFQQLQKLEALRDSLTHMIVHDLRTMLQGMTLNLELAAKQWRERLAQVDAVYLKRALKSTSSLKQMTSVMLDISRLEAGEMPLHKTDCDLVALCREATNLAGMETIEGQLTAVSDLPAAACDPDLVRRVMLNLISNALVHSPTPGSIRINIDANGETVNVAVIDQGPGIPPGFQERIFDKFSQVSHPGSASKPTSGLGLAFCKLAVEAHHGSIGVHSRPGQGATFWFSLPLSVAGKAPTPS